MTRSEGFVFAEVDAFVLQGLLYMSWLRLPFCRDCPFAAVKAFLFSRICVCITLKIGVLQGLCLSQFRIALSSGIRTHLTTLARALSHSSRRCSGFLSSLN